MALGDFNKDGKLDVVETNLLSNTVAVIFGNGSGGLAGRFQFGTGFAPAAVAIGDLTGEGNPDIAVANEKSNTVTTLLGYGDGTISGRGEFATGSDPVSVVIADLNGDGKADLALANSFANTVSVLLGTGAGKFGPKTDYGTGDSPFSVAPGDLNGDGRPDLVVANGGSNTISVLVNTGGVNPLPGPPPALPAAFELLSPRPNPASGTSEIGFALPAARKVRIEVFDVAGRLVRALVPGVVFDAGPHAIEWDARDRSGAFVRSGSYLVRARAGDEVRVRKLIVSR